MRSPITDAERPWLDVVRQPEGRAFLVEAITGLGYRYDVALAATTWADLKAQGAPDRTGPGTRSRYRKILRELTAAGATPPKIRGRRSQVGAAGVGTVAAIAGGGAAAMSHSPAAAVAVGLVYITYIGAEPESPAAASVGEAPIVRIDRASSEARRAPTAHLAAAA